MGIPGIQNMLSYVNIFNSPTDDHDDHMLNGIEVQTISINITDHILYEVQLSNEQ